VSLLLVLVYCGFGLLGFAVMAGFWPPPGEDLGARAISAYFAEHHLAITIGMIMMAAAGPFYFPWSAAISKIISRIEGPMGVLSTIELLGGLLTAIVTFVPATIWITASFRGAERSPELVHMLYDFGWMFFDITFFCSTLQCFALGVAILVDRRMVPLLPRWTAYVAFLTGLSYVPLLLMPLVTTGPFSWSGAVSFWVVFVMFFVMIAVVTPYAYRALRRLEREDLASLPAA
jgi:type IV secretory pathway TrbD component